MDSWGMTIPDSGPHQPQLRGRWSGITSCPGHAPPGYCRDQPCLVWNQSTEIIQTGKETPPKEPYLKSCCWFSKGIMWGELFVVQIFTACHWLALHPILSLCTYLGNYKKLNYLVVSFWLQISFFVDCVSQLKLDIFIPEKKSLFDIYFCSHSMTATYVNWI